jgi:hypothetical protein
MQGKNGIQDNVKEKGKRTEKTKKGKKVGRY